MGCTIPLSRMEAARDCRAAGSMTRRGCWGLGSSRSTATSAVDSAPRSSPPSGSGRRAASPLPSALRFMGHHLLGQVQVGLGPPGADVVEQDGLAEAGGLGEPHAARDDGAEDLVLEVLA